MIFLWFRFVDHFYQQLEPLFSADPLLLYDFIYLCPEDDYPRLFEKIPASLSLAWLSYKHLSHSYEVSECSISKSQVSNVSLLKAEKWMQWLEKVKVKVVSATTE